MVAQPLRGIVKKHKVAVTIPRRPRNDASTQKKRELPLSESGWIGIMDAVSLLAAHHGGIEGAQSSLLAQLSEGNLTCRASCWYQEIDKGRVDWNDIDWAGYKPIPELDGQIDRNIACEPVKDEVAIDVPRDVFHKANGWTIASEEVRWEVGLVVAKRHAEFLPDVRAKSGNLKTRRLVYGIQFHVAELSALIQAKPVTSGRDNDADVPAQVSQRSNRGRKRDPKWGPWHAEILVYARQEGIDTDMTAQEFFDAIAPRMTKRKLDCPDLGSATKEIGALFSRWREATQNGEIKEPSSNSN